MLETPGLYVVYDDAMNMDLDEQTDKQPCYMVSDETIAEGKKCEKGFSCLTGQREDLCQVESCINGKVHFIKCMNKEPCSYQGTFGDGVICHCPVQKELYNKHGV